MNKIDILLENGDLLDKRKLILYLKILKLKEKETYYHSIRVSKYSTLICKSLGLSDSQTASVWLSALLHDIGKILIPNYILLGTSQLSKNDYSLIQNHPLDGLLYLKDFVSRDICNGAIEHHERLDGKGYPYGKKDISLIGRIIAIADTFDAMTSNRTYQNTLSIEEALDKMECLSIDGLYDLEIFQKFKKSILELNRDDRCY